MSTYKLQIYRKMPNIQKGIIFMDKFTSILLAICLNWSIPILKFWCFQMLALFSWLLELHFLREQPIFWFQCNWGVDILTTINLLKVSTFIPKQKLFISFPLVDIQYVLISFEYLDLKIIWISTTWPNKKSITTSN